MLLIALAIMCLATSLNAEKVADWYWEQRYQSEKHRAAELIAMNMHPATATISPQTIYEPGSAISFKINAEFGPIDVQNYNPPPLEQSYVQQAIRGGHLYVYYEKPFPHRCVLGPTMDNARRLVTRPKPARVPDDKISRYISLAAKVLGGLLLLAGIMTFKNEM